jgi:hypothetical protein
MTTPPPGTPGSALTVVVSADDGDGLAVRDLALQWHHDGLLGEFAWVTPGDVDRAPYGPPTVNATVAGRDGRTELMTYLGMRPRSLVRVVLLHLLTHEMSDADTLVYTCDEIADLVNRARPRTIDTQGRHHGTQLLRINLMVPESDLHPQDPRIILPAWEVNAVVSPEDRPELDRQSIFVRRAINLHGHALNAAAATGGLWSVTDAGAFDSHESDSTTGGGEVVVVRCQARLVVGDDRSDELAQGVITALHESPIGAASYVPWAVPSDNPAALVRSSTERLMTHPEWTPPEREPDPLEKRQLTLGALLRQWALFQLRLVPAVLHFLSGWGRGLVERWVTAATVGRDAGDVGRVRPLPPDKVLQLARMRMQQLEDRLRPTRLEEEANSWGQTTPAAWRELRELAIGLVDGSRLPSRFKRATRGGAETVLPPGFVVGDPDDVHELDSGERIGLVDVERAAAVVAEKERARQEREAAAGRVYAGRRAERDRLQHPGREGPDHLGDDEADPFQGWLEQRQNTLLWQVTARVVDLKRQERARAAQAHRALTHAEPPATDKLEAAKRFLVGAWGVTLAVAAVLGLVAVLNTIEDPVGVLQALPDLDWVDLLQVVFVVLVVLLTAGTLYFQAMRSYDWAVTRRMHDLQQAGDDYVTARHEERRWQLMQSGLADWARILGQLLHRTWAPPTSPELEVPVYAGLPAAVAVAVPVDTDEGVDVRVVGRAIEHVCQKGWVAEEFGRLVAASPMNNPRDPGRQSHTGDLPADLDLGLRDVGPRRELTSVAERESSKRAATADLVAEVAALIHSGDVRLPPHTVLRVGAYSEGGSMLDRDFLTPRDQVAPFVTELFTPEAQLAQYQVPERSVFCLPNGIEAPRTLGSAMRAEVRHSDGFAAIRVDVSPLVTSNNIALFERIHRREQRPTSTPEDYN